MRSSDSLEPRTSLGLLTKEEWHHLLSAWIADPNRYGG
jgi:hypothetical protein